jgi:HSP20 family protein
VRSRCPSWSACGGCFEYRVRLPEQVDPDRVEAKLTDGVLSVRVPKHEQAERRRIQVKS